MATTEDKELAPLSWFYIALVVLGAFIGIAIGLSSSPVAATLLPILFSLIAGGTGIYAASRDVSQPVVRQRLNSGGKMLLAFIAPMVLSTVYAVSVRTGSDLGDFLPGTRTRPMLTDGVVRDQGVTAAVEIAALRYRLRQLGASEDEIDAVARAAISQTVVTHATNDIVAAFRTLSVKAAQARETITEDLAERLTGEQRTSLLRMAQSLNFISKQYEQYAKQLESDQRSPVQMMLSRLEADAPRISQLTHDRLDTLDWLMQMPELQVRLWDLELTFLSTIGRFGGSGWMSGGRTAEQIDKLLSGTRSGSAGQGTSEPRLRPSIAP